MENENSTRENESKKIDELENKVNNPEQMEMLEKMYKSLGDGIDNLKENEETQQSNNPNNEGNSEENEKPIENLNENKNPQQSNNPSNNDDDEEDNDGSTAYESKKSSPEINNLEDIWRNYRDNNQQTELEKETEIPSFLQNLYNSLGEDANEKLRQGPNYDEIFKAYENYVKKDSNPDYLPIDQDTDSVSKNRKEQFDQHYSDSIDLISKEQRELSAKLKKINASRIYNNDFADNFKEKGFHYDFIDSANFSKKGLRKVGCVASDITVGLVGSALDAGSEFINKFSKKVNDAANGLFDAATSGTFFGFIMGIVGIGLKMVCVAADISEHVAKRIATGFNLLNNKIKNACCKGADTHIYDFSKAMGERLAINNIETQKKQEEIKRLKEEMSKSKDKREIMTKKKQIANLNLDIKKMALESDQINKFFRGDATERQKAFDRYKERISGVASSNLYYNGDKDRELYSKLGSGEEHSNSEKAMQGVLDYLKDTIDPYEVEKMFSDNPIKQPEQPQPEQPQPEQPQPEQKKEEPNKFNEADGKKENPIDDIQPINIEGEGETIKNEQNNDKYAEPNSSVIKSNSTNIKNIELVDQNEYSDDIKSTDGDDLEKSGLSSLSNVDASKRPKNTIKFNNVSAVEKPKNTIKFNNVSAVEKPKNTIKFNNVSARGH